MKLATAESFHPWVISIVGPAFGSSVELAANPRDAAWQAWTQALLKALRTRWRVGVNILNPVEPEPNILQKRSPYAEDDLLVIFGEVKDPPLRLICLDLEPQASTRLHDKAEPQTWQAVISPEGLPQTDPPHFLRADIQGLVSAIAEALAAHVAHVPLIGLVLAGGYSRRMQQDKAQLNYHGQSQLAHSYALLSNVCSQVLISCREDQAEKDWPLDPALPALPWSYDRFHNLGPVGGILTAMMTHPHAAFLVIAVDLPWLDLATLSHLIQARRPLGPATAFLSRSDALPEPLCAIYEPRMRERLFGFWGLGMLCPRKALIHSATHLLALPEAFRLDNANTPADFEAISKALSQGND
ncbi:MAG: NTP transferase domain-containing protein [Candidatus Sericytochromatia bacterium]|nr:NTP transferase domain-containing protein [Candidatus Sericytochromatia bacterium]